MAEKVTGEKPSKKGNAVDGSSDDAAESKQGRWRRFFSKRWFAVLLVASVVIHVALFACRPAMNGASAANDAEIELGQFKFSNPEVSARLSKADFKLHVSLLLGTERIAGGRLAERKFLVQQGVEELLRQAHAADFDDPTLSELKRQIQEKINESLEMRTVENVIITDLELTERPAAAATATKTQTPTLDPPPQAVGAVDQAPPNAG